MRWTDERTDGRTDIRTYGRTRVDPMQQTTQKPVRDSRRFVLRSTYLAVLLINGMILRNSNGMTTSSKHPSGDRPMVLYGFCLPSRRVRPEQPTRKNHKGNQTTMGVRGREGGSTAPCFLANLISASSSPSRRCILTKWYRFNILLIFPYAWCPKQQQRTCRIVQYRSVTRYAMSLGRRARSSSEERRLAAVQ